MSTDVDRDEFERRGYCARCGRRLDYSQDTIDNVQRMRKFCPRWKGDASHDYLRHDHPFPYRNRHGRVSDGTKHLLADKG